MDKITEIPHIKHKNFRNLLIMNKLPKATHTHVSHLHR